MIKLSRNQERALLALRDNDGVLISRIPESNEKDEFGDVIPGIMVYKSLDKIGLVLITEEDPILFDGDDDEFLFTPSVCLTDEGRNLANLLATM